MSDVFDADVLVRGLHAAGEPFGPRTTVAPVLRWGPLLASLDGTFDEEYLTAVELIYEGYLFHYRESRVSDVAGGEYGTTLLAGDYLYAAGLRLIAARGDVAAVDLLTRLMAACSYLRSVGAPFAADDALWAYTVGGLAALQQGVASDTVAELFYELDIAVAAVAIPDVRALARASAAALLLSDPAPLIAELEGPLSPSDPTRPPQAASVAC